MEHRKLGVYVHIPFCRKKCYYCDFASFVSDQEIWDRYIEELIKEVQVRSRLLSNKEVDSIFFGGGTPSLMGPDRLGRILEVLKREFRIDKNVEITFEANPETVDPKEWVLYRNYGFNRVSIGVQSLQEEELIACGRIHNRERAINAIQYAYQAGFKKINMDLMYGIPKQSFESLKSTVKEALALPIEHLSIYGLQLEEGTLFFEWYQKGELDLPVEDEVLGMHEWLTEYLPSKGFRRYEISNFCKDSAESQHNLKYWQYQPYIGFGSGACSFDGEVRQENPETINGYFNWMKKMDSNLGEVNVEKLTLQERMAEFCFMGLRTLNGISIEEFDDRFQISMDDVYKDSIKKAKQEGWIEQKAERIFPTSLGLKWSNQLSELFLL